MEWTFDPLELKNAHFNLVRLGAVARRYIPDRYGVTESPLHAGLPTDRLVAEWLSLFGAREGNSGWEFAAGESGSAEDFHRCQYLGVEEREIERRANACRL